MADGAARLVGGPRLVGAARLVTLEAAGAVFLGTAAFFAAGLAAAFFGAAFFAAGLAAAFFAAGFFAVVVFLTGFFAEAAFFAAGAFAFVAVLAGAFAALPSPSLTRPDGPFGNLKTPFSSPRLRAVLK